MQVIAILVSSLLSRPIFNFFPATLVRIKRGFRTFSLFRNTPKAGFAKWKETVREYAQTRSVRGIRVRLAHCSVPENCDEFWMNDAGCMHNSISRVGKGAYAYMRGLQTLRIDFSAKSTSRSYRRIVFQISCVTLSCVLAPRFLAPQDLTLVLFAPTIVLQFNFF